MVSEALPFDTTRIAMVTISQFSSNPLLLMVAIVPLLVDQVAVVVERVEPSL